MENQTTIIGKSECENVGESITGNKANERVISYYNQIIGSLTGCRRAQVFPLRNINGEDNAKDKSSDKQTLNAEWFVSNVSPREFGFKPISPTLQARDYKDPKIIAFDVYNKKLRSESPTLSDPCHNNIRLIELTQHTSDAQRVYDSKGIAKTLKGEGGGQGAKTGLYMVGELQQTCFKRSNDTPKEINQFLKDNKKDFTIEHISVQLELPKTQVEHYFRTDDSRAIPSPEVWNELKVIMQFDDTYDKQVTEIYEKEIEFETSRRIYSEEGISPTLSATDKGKLIQSVAYRTRSYAGKEGAIEERKDEVANQLTTCQKDSMVKENMRIRRLTPTECELLQGFPDGWTEKGIDEKGNIVNISDSQRYKTLGNAVTINVVQAIMEKLLRDIDENS
jgi:site-specific DNA-cytosine methylase